MSATSPGPWKEDDGAHVPGEITILDADGEEVCRINCFGDAPEVTERDRANSQLIVQTPTLRDELARIVNCLKHGWSVETSIAEELLSYCESIDKGNELST